MAVLAGGSTAYVTGLTTAGNPYTSSLRVEAA